MPRWSRLLSAAVVLMALAGCQLDVDVAVQVNDDGSGVVTVAAGVDEAALARVGNLERQLRVDDLSAAGWEVEAPEREGEVTWVRASKAFTTPEEAGPVLDQLTGVDGAFRNFDVRVDDGLLGKEYALSGVVDLTAGPIGFGDAELSAVDGDPFGQTLARVEQEEGRPVADMVSFQVTVELPGAEPVVYEPSFADETATTVSVRREERSGVVTIAIWTAVVVVGVAGLVVLRRAFGGRRSSARR